MSDEPSDIDLLSAWTDGDENAGSQLLRRHFRTLYRFFRSKVGNATDDLVQQTMLACTRSIEQFRGEASFRTYLLALARNQLLMHLRSYGRKGSRIDDLDASIADVLGSPSVALADRDEQALVTEGLRHIPLELQIVLELHYWEELKVAQIATIVDAPVGTVKSRLHRGRRLLREWIESNPKFDSDQRRTSLAVIAKWSDESTDPKPT